MGEATLDGMLMEGHTEEVRVEADGQNLTKNKQTKRQMAVIIQEALHREKTCLRQFTS